MLLQQHGEPAVYRPKGGDPRPITVIVVRNGITALEGGKGAIAPQVMVEVLDDALLGMESAEVNTGADMIDVAVRKGGKLQSMRIGEYLDTMGGFTVWKVQ